MGVVWWVGGHKWGGGKWPEKGMESIKESAPNRNLFFWAHSQVMSSVFLPLIFNIEEFFSLLPHYTDPNQESLFSKFLLIY